MPDTWECDICGDDVSGFEPDYDWRGDEFVLTPKPLCDECKLCAAGKHRATWVMGCACEECVHCGILLGKACSKCRYEDAMESAEDARRDR